MLTGLAGPEGEELWSGWDNQTSLTHSPLTKPTIQAAQANNETRLGAWPE